MSITDPRELAPTLWIPGSAILGASDGALLTGWPNLWPDQSGHGRGIEKSVNPTSSLAADTPDTWPNNGGQYFAAAVCSRPAVWRPVLFYGTWQHITVPGPEWQRTYGPVTDIIATSGFTSYSVTNIYTVLQGSASAGNAIPYDSIWSTDNLIAGASDIGAKQTAPGIFLFARIASTGTDWLAQIPITWPGFVPQDQNQFYEVAHWVIVEVWFDQAQAVLTLRMFDPEEHSHASGGSGTPRFADSPSRHLLIGQSLGRTGHTQCAEQVFFNRPLATTERQDMIDYLFGAYPCLVGGGRQRMYTTAVGIH